MSKRRFKCPLEFRDHQRNGFTLIELLVVITIMIILLTMTLLAVNFSNEGDRVSGAARQVQSFLEGARDRAIYAKEPRGVRLFASPENPRVVTTMAYIAPGGTWPPPELASTIRVQRIDGNVGNSPTGTPPANGVFSDPEDQSVLVRGDDNPGWWNLKRRGWLVDGLRIRIPKGPTGTWYPLDTSLIDTSVVPTDLQFLILKVPYADGDQTGEFASGKLSYEIELPAKLLPQDPSILPDSVVINLDGSRIPQNWRPVSTLNNQFSGYMDIVFSPRGNLLGAAAGEGLLHFYVADAEDSRFIYDQFRSHLVTNSFDVAGFDANVGAVPLIPADDIPVPSTPVNNWIRSDGPYAVKDRRLVTVVAQTGRVTVHEVNSFTGSGGDADTADPFDIDNDAYKGPVNVGDPAEPDGIVDDPYAFAESGRVAR